MSLKAYAHHRGVSVEAVKKAIKHDRLKRSLVRTPQGRYKIRSIEAADKEWEANTDPSQQRGVAALNAEQLADNLEASIESGEDEEQSEGPGGQANARAWKAVRERYEAKFAKLKYDREVGKLVDRAEMEQLWLKHISEAKTKLLAVASKAKLRVPSLTPADIVALEDLVREALEDLANVD